ncbi:MAG: hypothetical protein HY348_02825 [Nitrospira defluvii]|nr:hypothetical protein [Nitrospira defluvii]
MPPAAGRRRSKQRKAGIASPAAVRRNENTERRGRRIWLLEIDTLGKVEIVIDGQSLETKRKASHRLLDLLKAIVAFGSEEVPVAKLSDALWPDADGDATQETFKKSLARLRQLLGVEEVVQLQHGCVSLNRELCWVDTLAFEVAVKRRETQCAAEISDKRLGQDGLGISTYKGPFLGLDTCPPWASPYRESLRRRFVRLCLCEAERAQADQQVDLARRRLEQAIEVDPLAEPIYQRLMLLHKANGHHAEVAALYDHCRFALGRWAGLRPSPETEVILHST